MLIVTHDRVKLHKFLAQGWVRLSLVARDDGYPVEGGRVRRLALLAALLLALLVEPVVLSLPPLLCSMLDPAHWMIGRLRLCGQPFQQQQATCGKGEATRGTRQSPTAAHGIRVEQHWCLVVRESDAV